MGLSLLTNYSQHEQWQSIPVIVITAKDLTKQDRQQLSDSVVRILQKGGYNRKELLAYLARFEVSPPGIVAQKLPHVFTIFCKI